MPDDLMRKLACDHNKRSGRIMANRYLEIDGYENGAFVVGDCACVTDPVFFL